MVNEVKQYGCAVCGKVYNTIAERANCERDCLKKKAEEEKKAAQEKLRKEKADRKQEVDNAYKVAAQLKSKYVEDYGSYVYYEGDVARDFADFLRMLP